MAILYIIRGLPGSGKTTLAWRIASPWVYEADQYFHQIDKETGEIVYKFNSMELRKAHADCQERAEFAMKNGRVLAVSNTFTQKWEVKPYIEMARKYNYSVVIITVQSEFDSIHNVPKEAIERMKGRWEHFTLSDF